MAFIPLQKLKESIDNIQGYFTDLKQFVRGLNKLDSLGRIRINAEALGTLSTITTVTTVTTVTSMTSLGNQVTIGGIDARIQQANLSRISFNQNFLSRLS